MAKNYMQDVAKLLGVELEEEFKLTGYSGTFVLTNKGMMWLAPDKRRSSEAFALECLLTGRNELVRLPWQPEGGDEYYYPACKFKDVFSTNWTYSVVDFAYKEAGLIFKTYEECEAALPALRKKSILGN
jgi:hypothetical protein